MAHPAVQSSPAAPLLPVYVTVFILRLRAELIVSKGHPPLAPGAAPPASSTIGGLPGLFINPNPAVVCLLFYLVLGTQCSQLNS
jgi:hypothetical protein